MNELREFNNSEFGVLGIIEIEGKPYFPATKCAEILGYSNGRDAIDRHCKGVVKHDVPSASGIQTTNFIPEGDLYRLIIRSKLPSAERFERWVFDEVLPTMRKAGGYISNADLMVNTYFGQLDEDRKFIVKGLFSQIEKQQELLTRKDKQLDEQRPLVYSYKSYR